MKRGKAYLSGFAAGVEGFRLVGGHEIPRQHPHGSTDEGRDWFLGCAAGLEQCEAIFAQVHGQRATKADALARNRTPVGGAGVHQPSTF